MNLLQTKRENIQRLEAELQAARNGGAVNVGKVREAQSALKRGQADLARLEARVRELKDLLECLESL